ncbi:RidA family protein [Xinfangfangia sp. CPCC 101601]|uniref:RidA family protein n=1 Tax=Pseudogemmobacter lacusdianii TaxID=3069608 RepID=A0ABU0VV07_9RHOB|nr:RidA family protein [Xinfangfangia sp. CPCC 101601]MDQ2065483.1 RidA family protein [Xinfangfangia sp. CPCC 101601]
MRKTLALAAMVASLPVLAFPALAEGVVRHKTPGSDFPIARAVEVPGGSTTVYLSGVVPAVAKADADPATAEAWGDTKTQTISVLTTIEATLKDLDLTMGDVVKMQVFLVAPDGQPADFSGFMEGYTQFFGTEAQPNLPSRSAMIVDALVHPQWLVEIEVTAVRPSVTPAAEAESPAQN